MLEAILKALEGSVSLYKPVSSDVAMTTAEPLVAPKIATTSSPKKDIALSTLRARPELMDLSGRDLEKWGLDNGIEMSYKLWNEAKKQVKGD